MNVNTRKLLTCSLILLVVLTLCFIWGNSLQSSEASSNISNTLLDFVNKHLGHLGLELKDDHFLRKLAHFGEFALLGMEMFFLVSLRRLKRTKASTYVLTLAFCLFVAVTDETIQLFVGRSCLITDVILDFAGSFIGVFFAKLLITFVFKFKNGLIQN